MPLFHFSVQDGRNDTPRSVLQLPDVFAAKAEALQLAGQMLRDNDRKASFDEDWRIEVTDAVGMVLFRMHISLSTSTAAHLQGSLTQNF